MPKKEKTVEVDLELGSLMPLVRKAARRSGVDVNEFIVNALQSRVRSEDEHHPRRDYTRHGGKHLMGKRTGYELTPDGKYYPAPSWTQQFDELFTEREAVHALVNSIIDHANERLVRIEKRINEVKAGLLDDLGLDTERDWIYYGGRRHYLQEKVKAEKESE